MRLRLNLAYDGGAFHGWATQPGLRTVQGELEEALRTLLRREAVPVTCAGRTDTGVHARGQVVHLDTSPEELRVSAGRIEGPLTESLRRRLNGMLGEDVRVHAVHEAPAGFDARFSALWRRYAYRVADEPALIDPLLRGHVLAWPRRLDLSAMNEAAAGLTGEHDFAAFCKRREGATTIRDLRTLVWERDERGTAVATVRADAFCHSMVRSLVGALLPVGEGKRAPSWPAQVLSAEVRDSSVMVAPAHGLCLEEVAYPPDEQLAERAAETRVVRTRG